MTTAARKAAVSGRVESPTPASPTARNHASQSPRREVQSPARRAAAPRSGTPVSARAAVQRRDSTRNSTSEAENNVRAEKLAMIEDLKSRLAGAETQVEQLKRQGDVAQTKLDEAHKEQAKLEEKVHEFEEQIEVLRNEKRDAARQLREMESVYETERSAMTKEREQMTNREEELQMIIQRLKDHLAAKTMEDDGRSSRQISSPAPEGGGFAPPSSVQRSDSRNNSKLLLQKDKLIESLRLDLAEAQMKIAELDKGPSRLLEVEKQLVEARMTNARLIEDNESYQLLLQEKTLNGDLTRDLGFLSANQEALNALEGRSPVHEDDGDQDSHGHRARRARPMSSLADELMEAQDDDSQDENRARRLEAELKTSKDENKALTLYINKIIGRLLQHQEYEHILDQSQDMKPKSPNASANKELPPPPMSPLARHLSTGSFLQRAKSITMGAPPPAPPGSKLKPRPVSILPPASAVESAHTDPDRAPSIPLTGLGRSSSVRRRPQSEQFPGAAGVVNQMYRGLEGNGLTSPSLVSPRSSGAGYFPKRASSGAAMGTLASSGNFPGMKSETSSTISSSESIGADGSSTTATSAPGTSTTPTGSSPPKSRDHPGMNKFEGNKPRPLRLVQENNEALLQASSNKRGTWFGWMSGPKKDDSAQPGSAH